MQSVSVHVLFNATGSVRSFPWFFLGGEYVCLSYGQLKSLKSAELGRKSVLPFIKKLRNPFLSKILKSL